MKKKTIAALMACTMVLGCAIGGTMAWLTDKTTEVVNTFTVGDINIDLSESVDSDEDGKHIFHFVPGDTLAKDPVITVERGSEACWLFVKVEEANNENQELTGKIINWDVRTETETADGGTVSEWTALPGETNVWYREVPADAAKAGTCYYVLTAGENENEENGHVTVNSDVTKEMVENINAAMPELTFTAYAIQSANLTDQNNDGTVDAKDAWLMVLPSQDSEV